MSRREELLRAAFAAFDRLPSVVRGEVESIDAFDSHAVIRLSSAHSDEVAAVAAALGDALYRTGWAFRDDGRFQRDVRVMVAPSIHLTAHQVRDTAPAATQGGTP